MEKIERGVVPTQKAIQKHWYSEVTGERASYWAETLGDLSFEVILEDGGCSCYACGKSSKHLQRCHIVPHMLGGSMEPSNLVLLCRECHQDNPDTKYADMFYNYVKSVPYWFSTECEKLHKHFSNIKNAADLADKEKFDGFVRGDKISTDFMYSACGGHLGVGLNNKMSHASVASAVWKGITA